MGTELLMELVKALVAALKSTINVENVKAVIDKAFDAVEDKVRDSETKWDDIIVIPVLEALRKALNVPDNDE